jgi:cytochrome c oxidase cbb3-type subunit 3
MMIIKMLLALALFTFVCATASPAYAVDKPLSAYKKQQILKGEWYFERHCTFCHGKDGRGLVGPNLTDAYFIYGSDRATMEKIITEGLPDKGMPTWSTLLPDDQMAAIKEYVWSLRGKNLPGKAPEGDLLEENSTKKDK